MKQLTMFEHEDHTTVCDGGKVVISQDDDDVWIIEAFDSDGRSIENRWADAREEVEKQLKEFIYGLAEYASRDE